MTSEKCTCAPRNKFSHYSRLICVSKYYFPRKILNTSVVISNYNSIIRQNKYTMVMHIERTAIFFLEWKKQEV